MKKFVLFGDSLTQYSFDPLHGWGSHIAHKYQRRIDVINRGVSGYNTRMALHVFDKHFDGVLDDKVVLCTVFFGANDAVLLHTRRGPKPNQYVPLDEYKLNLGKMIDLLRARCPNARIVVFTPPPVHEATRVTYLRDRFQLAPSDPDPPADREMSNTQKYAEAAAAVGLAKGADVVDMFTGLQDRPDFGTAYFYDGLHFTPGGQDRVAALAMAAIEKHFDVETMPMNVPWWGDIIDEVESAVADKP